MTSRRRLLPSASLECTGAEYTVSSAALPASISPLPPALSSTATGRGLGVTQLLSTTTPRRDETRWRRRRQAGTADRVHRSTTTSVKPEGQASPSRSLSQAAGADPPHLTGPQTSHPQRACPATRQGTNAQRLSSTRKSMLKVIKKTTTTCSIVDRVPLDGARPNVATPPPMMMTKTLATRSGNQTSRPRPTGSSSSRARVSDSRAAGRPSRPSETRQVHARRRPWQVSLELLSREKPQRLTE